MVWQNDRHWFRSTLQLKGSVVATIFPRTLFCAGFGLMIAYAYSRGVNLAFPALTTLIPNIVLGLLLVFRTNTAYDRFWEGRKSWGTIIVNSRNLSRQIWVNIIEVNPTDRTEKIHALRLLEAFALASKHHLRQEPVDPIVIELVSIDESRKLSQTSNPPLEIAFWLHDYLQSEYDQGQLHIYQLTTMQALIDRLVEALSGCERILKTPMPLAYAIHLKQLLLLYCLSLPFQMVDKAQWSTPVVVAFISFMVFGIEAIGLEIENPFGRDPNDLPLDGFCETIRSNIEDLIQLEPRRGGGSQVNGEKTKERQPQMDQRNSRT
jgi:ion channel-forming bestrophin family protein